MPSPRLRGRAKTLHLESQERRAQAMELYARNVPVPRIAEQLGYADRRGAWKAIQSGIKEHPKLAAEEVRTVLERSLLDVAGEMRLIAVRAAQRGSQPNMTPKEIREEEKLRLAALDKLIRAQESLRQLGGYDMPQKVEHAGPEGGAIPIEVRTEQVRERLASLRALPAGEETG